MRLADTQRLLADLIRAPEGVVKGLEQLADRERVLAGGLGSVIAGDERLSAVERLDVYANMYFYRILDCLKEDFPALLASIGDTRFHDLVTGYLLEHPSTHPSIRFAGRHLAGFLARHEDWRDEPWLADLARFEWAILDAFDAPDAEPLAAERLEAVPAEAWPTLRLRLTPSLSLLELGHSVDRLWAAANEGRELPAIEAGPATIRVWRQQLRVFHRPVDAIEAAALERARAADELGAVCEAVAAVTGEAEAAVAALRVLRSWFADGLVIGLG